MVGALGKKVSKVYETNVASTYVNHRSGADPNYRDDIHKFVEEYKKDKLCHVIPGRYHRGFENFVFDCVLDNPTNLIKRLGKYSCKMDIQRRIQQAV